MFYLSLVTNTELNYNTVVFSPLEQFEIRNLLSFDASILGGINLSITNIGLYLTIGALIILTLNILATNYNKIGSNNWSISNESLYATIHSIVVNQINETRGQIYFPFIYTLFIFILVNNLIGMVWAIPYCNFDYIFTLSSLLISNKKVKGNSCSANWKYSTSSSSNNHSKGIILNPHFLTGFIDAEGCFNLTKYSTSSSSNNNSSLPLFVPVVIYSNFNLNKAQILKENKGKSGVYMFKNLISGKVYIGSSADISKRFAQYLKINSLKNNTSMYICKALLKHGHENFSFAILEYCEVNLMEREEYYLNLLWDADIPRYNISKNPTAPMSGRIHSLETLKKMSVWIRSPETRKRIAGALYGRNQSEETKKKISGAMSGENNPMFGRPRPTGTGRASQAIEVFDLDTNETTQYESISAAAIALGISRDSIRNTFRQNQQKPYKGRYIFKKTA